MKITELHIKDFKCLKNVHMTDISDVVVLAGPNGVGKSSILDAIVTFKEIANSYFGYPDYSNIQKKVMVNADCAEITITFQLAPEEVSYLKKFYGEEQPSHLIGTVTIPRIGILRQKIPEQLRGLLGLYERAQFPDIGIFEYMFANRLLKKKNLNAVDTTGLSVDMERRLRVTESESDQKFNFTKDYLLQMTLADLRILQIQKMKSLDGKISFAEIPDSLKTIKEIFGTLLAPKELIGVNMNASPMEIIINTPDGKVELDDLSSGEKEIISVFVNLLKLRLKNSIVLFDEPDLHLNQELDKKLVSALKTIGTNNQFWIATHSFGIMESVGYKELYRLDNSKGDNRVIRVFNDSDKYATFRSVAGNAGIITLGEKIVFLEGIEFTDKTILETWFEKSKSKLTFVNSGPVSNILKVNDKVLNLLQTSSRFNFFFAIRDRDFLSDIEKEKMANSSNRLFIWDKYHIENYLLDFNAINEILANSFSPKLFSSADEVKAKFKDTVIADREFYLSKMVKSAVNKRIGPIFFDVGIKDVKNQALLNSEETIKRISDVLNKDEISKIVSDQELLLQSAIDSDTWVNILPGRDLLQSFLKNYAKRFDYDLFRNQLTREIMHQDRIPAEILGKISKILSMDA